MFSRTVFASALFVLIGSTATAGDDPAIQGEARKGIQAAMTAHLEGAQVDGVYYIYDPVADSVLELKFKELHAGIVRKGSFYASCADFAAGDTAYDLDFLVIDDGDSFKVVDVIVHKVGDEKRDYLRGGN